jgi:hypothetical protein
MEEVPLSGLMTPFAKIPTLDPFPRANCTTPPELSHPEALGAFHRAEIKKWWPIVKAAGFRAQ